MVYVLYFNNVIKICIYKKKRLVFIILVFLYLLGFFEWNLVIKVYLIFNEI